MATVTGHQSAAAGQLYRVIAEQEDGNVFLSPFSISTALTMVAAGADGNTASQLRLALTLPEDMTTLHEDYSRVLDKLQNPPNVTLSTANKLYVQDSYRVLESYTGLLKTQYRSEVKTVNFGDGAGASKLINSDVETETRGRIRDLVKPNDLEDDVRLVLVNAIYFKGSWTQKFFTRRIQGCDFFVSPGNSVKTQMMFMSGIKFNCGHILELGCKALEMPYEGDRFSMIILLPDQLDGLKDMEGKLPSSSVRDIRGSLSNRMAVIRVPKFKLETSYELTNTLQALAISDLFSRKADLSKITGDTELYVSKVVHKAFIEVNEEGAEAAAASAGISIAISAPLDEPRPFKFIADHPFCFIIFDRETGLTLFSGRYVRPAQDSGGEWLASGGQ